MLVLYESPAGYSLFKVLDEAKLKVPELIHKEFVDGTKTGLVSLQAFHKFADTNEAVAAATAVIESKLDKGLKKFLKKNIVSQELKDTLGVADSKLGGVIKEKLGIACVNDAASLELMRGIRGQFEDLVEGLSEDGAKAMSLGLSHSLSRYKLKFSPDKVDTMIVQAINLLDELDKEINTYAMRVREWYGWHFPELAKIVNDNMHYARIVLKAGMRTAFKDTDFSDILDDDIEKNVKDTCEVSMGTDISEEDLGHIRALADQVLSMTQYRAQLSDYLKNRMVAIAPNLTVMVGELVGARLIAHAGSLMNLAKAPASTVQILGAEKALFRALKTKHETPKYGLIYHASLIGQTAQKNKGKIARVLAAKCALSIRVDALGDEETATIGLECRAKVEARMRQLETGEPYTLNSSTPSKVAKYDAADTPKVAAYNADADNTASASKSSKKEKKSKKDKKRKSEEVDAEDDMEVDDVTAETPKAKKSKKDETKSEKKIVRAFKKEFNCNGTVIEHSEHGEVIQLQGDQRNNIKDFLMKVGLAKDEQLKVHGF